MRVHEAGYVGKRVQPPDVLNDSVCIPRGSAESHTVAQLCLEIAVGKRIGEAAARSHHGLAAQFSRRQADGDARRAVRQRRIKLGPDLLPHRNDIGPEYDRFCEFRDAGRA